MRKIHWQDGEKAMIGEIVRYRAPAGARRDDMIEDARAVVAKWRANPDLIRKDFLWSDDGEWCCGFYLWRTRAAAERAHDTAWRAAVEQRTGAAPEIAYFDAFMIIDNEAGTVTETPETR
jgi:hypothetical protein